MREKSLGVRCLVIPFACLVSAVDASVTALAQPGSASSKKTRSKRINPRKSAKSELRPKSGIEEKTVADRIVLRGGKELLGQIDMSATDALPTCSRWTIHVWCAARKSMLASPVS
jgi:hypothetical protein